MKADRLKSHLDAAYRVAQMVTLDARAASELVERAFQNAYADDPQSWPEDEVRDRLIRHVIAAHQPASAEGEPDDGHTSYAAHPALAAGFRSLAIQRGIDRLLPSALALVPDRLRTLALLTETENLSPHDAARIFGWEAARIHELSAEARTRLRDAIMQKADAAERELFEGRLSDEVLRQALIRHARSRLAPAPPTLALQPTSRPDSVRPEVRPPNQPVRSRTAIRPRQVLYGLLAVVFAALAGYVGSILIDSRSTTDVVTLAAKRMDNFRIELESSSASDVESFLLEETRQRVRLPAIRGAYLRGAGSVLMSDDVRVPVVVFRDENTLDDVPILVLSYATLDRHSGNLRLERDVMQQIQDDGHFDLHDLGDARVLIWRSRDEIFVAATRGDASELQDRIQPAM